MDNVHQIILLPPADIRTPIDVIQRDRSRQRRVCELTETIDPQVISMVFPQDLNLAGSLAKRKAVHEEYKLNAYDRNVKSSVLRVAARTALGLPHAADTSINDAR